MKSTLQLFKLLSNTLKSLSILHWCQLTNATILVPTTTTQTPLGTIIFPFGVVGNHLDYHTLATTIGNHHQLEPPSIGTTIYHIRFSNQPSQLFKSFTSAFQKCQCVSMNISPFDNKTKGITRNSP